VAASLLEKETIDGSEVGRLVDDAYGRPVHEHADVVPRFSEDDDMHDEASTPAAPGSRLLRKSVDPRS
jgi:hypothetical protein